MKNLLHNRGLTHFFLALGAVILLLQPSGGFGQRVRAQPSVKVKKKMKRTVEVKKGLLTPNVTETSANPTSRPDLPPPTAPLYRRFAPDRVVVAEVGGEYLLTRADLENMIAARGKLSKGTKLKRYDSEDEYHLREKEKRRRKMEDELLYNWALLKTLVLKARKAGYRVNAQEVEERIQELSREWGGTDAETLLGGATRLIGMDREQVRRDLAEGLLIDTYLISEIEKHYTDAELEEIYNKSPARYATPMKFHLWQIFRKIDRTTTKEEIKDQRKQFYKLRKKAARKGGKDFEELARVHSDDEATRSKGGDMGWIDSSFPLPETVLRGLRKLHLGEVSEIVSTQVGLHIYRVTEIEQAKGYTFDASARKRVIDQLIYAFKDQFGMQLLRNAKASSGIQVKINPSGLRLIAQSTSSPRDR